jgi:U3 small nucleolar RNA-associated protein 14
MKTFEKVKNKLKKQAKKMGDLKVQQEQDAVMHISTDNVLGTKRKERTGVTDDSSGDFSDNEELAVQEANLQHRMKSKASGIKAFEQRDLVAMAFAGDNVVEEFKQTKQREIEADAPREIDTTIPGWVRT